MPVMPASNTSYGVHLPTNYVGPAFVTGVALAQSGFPISEAGDCFKSRFDTQLLA